MNVELLVHRYNRIADDECATGAVRFTGHYATNNKALLSPHSRCFIKVVWSIICLSLVWRYG